MCIRDRDNTGESGGENIGDEDPAAEDTDKKDTDIAENDSENHLPKRQEDIPESETYETEGYWNVSLSEIFQDPDGDDLTYYEKGERDEDWTPAVSYTHLDVYKRQVLGQRYPVYSEQLL